MIIISIILDNDQKDIVDRCEKFIKSYTSGQVFEFGGFAGAGKSTVLNAIVDRLGVPLDRIICMAYIGQAAINMRLKGLYGARTAYSHLFKTIEEEVYDNHGNVVIDPYYGRPRMKHTFLPLEIGEIKADYMIVDEAYTMPDFMKEHIEKHGIKIIACGDPAQLGPVIGKPAYLREGTSFPILEKVHRQGEDSDILYLSKRIREGLPVGPGVYNNVLVIYREDLKDYMLRNSNIIICGYNKTRDYFNHYIRKNIMKRDSTLPQVGDRVVCRKNNWEVEIDGIALANGLNGIVINSDVRPPDFRSGRFFMDFKPDLLNYSFNGLECDYTYFNANYKERNDMRNRPYSNGNLFEYGYAISTHMGQGAQFNNGIYVSQKMNHSIQQRLDYTGITRFKYSAIYVID